VQEDGLLYILECISQVKTSLFVELHVWNTDMA